MNNSFTLIRKLSILSIIGLLVAATLACQLTSGLKKTSAPPSPASTMGEIAPRNATPAEATPGTGGAFSLSQPAVGLNALSSYHQSFTSAMKGTYQGKPYEASSNVDRRVNGQDEISQVQATTSGEKPYYLQLTRLGGQTYVQQKAGQACRAQDQSSQADQELNPAAKLPPVFGASPAGSDTIADMPALRYRFDADAVRYQAGKNGTAEGDVWVAQEGGAVLKYQLTVEIMDGDFIGTRTWAYELDDVNKEVPVSLPDGCLPLLTDLPALPGATEVVSTPGFLSYVTNSNIDAAVKFFQEQLPEKDWYAIPGDKPQSDSALLKFARSMEDGSGQLLAIQLSTQGQRVLVVIQIINTHQPVQAVNPPAAKATLPANEPTETPGTESGSTLPEGLPVYPGAKVILQNSQVLMCQTTATVDQVAKFY
jgi:hypothetical protein